MSDTVTPNYEFILPEPNGSDNTWGLKLNDNLVALDTILHSMLQQIGAVIPTGAVQAFAMQSSPVGWLEMDASWKSKAEYPNLWNTIGDTYLDGEPARAGEFRLPEGRGGFIRGWDHGKGVDTGRVFGSQQLDAFQGHDHSITGRTVDTSVNSYDSSNAGDPDISFVSDPIGAPTTLTGYGTVRYASETRPRNVAMLYCIKI